jgi:hypothetical protein
MPGYINRTFLRFTHSHPQHVQHAPHEFPALDLANIKRVQEVLGMLLYYARAIDYTMLVAIGSIATQQSNAT